MRRLLCLCTALLGCFPPLLVASDFPDPFTLKGHVLDQSRGCIAGATIQAIPEGTGVAASAVSDQAGEFALVLQPDTYTVTVTAPGFDPASQSVRATPGGSDGRDFVLSVAGVKDTLTVSAPPGYEVDAVRSATKTLTLLGDVPQAVTVVTKELIHDQLMASVGDVIRYVPGMGAHQGENNRDQVIIRGNSSSADFFVNGVRDDVQYYRDLYNLDRIEALKGPNALIFGRGGGGGVVNRVTKEAGLSPLAEVTVQGGAYGNKRVAGDVNRPLTNTLAARLNSVFEHSESFRHGVNLERYGVNPTLTWSPTAQTRINLAYEFLHDSRVADRGITSFGGVPVDVDRSTYYGNADDSYVKARVNLTSATIEHRRGSLTFRNHTLAGAYDRSYQNYVPGAVTADRSQVALTAYNNATDRLNLFNQTDVTWRGSTGAVQHTLLFGAEAGRQLTDNFRNTGFFNNTATSIVVPFENPTTKTPVSYRQNATDADNHIRTNVAAAYAQDQVELSRHVDVVAGVRFDRFDLQYHNNRNGDTLDRVDGLVSPRAGLVVKPARALSLYTSYSVSYLPSSGDQFSSLTTITQQVEPEKFNNYEVGAKWDVRPALALTAAVYRLDRTNTRATDPNDPTRIVQTGSQRTNGFELGVNGQIVQDWKIAGGYAYQDAFVTSATIAARTGAQVGQVPHHTLSLWNQYQFHPRFAAAVGIVHRTDMFATIDNTVLLDGYTRADLAAFLTLTPTLRLQANVENLFDANYFVNADSNTNISPGTPRALRVALTAVF